MIRSVIRRFKLEDLVVQDSSGVVFRAFDVETNQMVALRRFFPFGASGNGLDAEQQAAYGIAVERLSKISHPALRSIICGGCDPVDGMPFVATEWIEGIALQTLLWSRVLEELEAITVISLALEVCEILSEVMAEEGIWIETDSHTIILGGKETQRPVTFWISPLKWLGHDDGKHSLEPFIALTTSITGWAGKPFQTLSTTGLGDWLAWLYSAARTATLHEAREQLSKAVGVDPPLPVRRHTRQTTRQASTVPAKAPARIMACAALILLGAGGWWMIKKNDAVLVKAPAPLVVKIASAKKDTPPLAVATAVPEAAPVNPEPVVAPTASEKPPVENLQVAPPPPAETTSAIAPPAENPPGKPAPVTPPPAKAPPVKTAPATHPPAKVQIAAKSGVFSAADYEKLLGQENKKVVVEGTFDGVAYSSTKKTMYLKFTEDRGRAGFSGKVAINDATDQLAEASLRSLKGTKIRLSGMVNVEPPKRPFISVKKFNEIELVK
jgi:hypothetical protein